MIRATLIVVVAGGLVIGVFAPVLLELFFGSAYAEGSTALRITLVAMIPLSVQRLMASDLKGRGRAGLVSVSAGFALVATVACDVILIPPFGIAGASLASVLAYSTGAAAMLVAYRRVTGASLRHLVPGPGDVRTLALASATALRRL